MRNPPRPCQLFGRRIFSVSKENGGYRVCLSWLPGMDEMWESLAHFALFGSLKEAETMAAKIKARGHIDLNYWVWSPTRCSPLAFMQEKPTAVLEREPRV